MKINELLNAQSVRENIDELSIERLAKLLKRVAQYPGPASDIEDELDVELDGDTVTVEIQIDKCIGPFTKWLTDNDIKFSQDDTYFTINNSLSFLKKVEKQVDLSEGKE